MAQFPPSSPSVGDAENQESLNTEGYRNQYYMERIFNDDFSLKGEYDHERK